MLSSLYSGFELALSYSNVAYIALGLFLGFVVGVLPGLNRSTAVAIAIPLTFYLSPVTAIAFLIGIAKGGASGGAVTAILVNTPGEPAAAVTCLDGYPLTKQGKAGKALKVSLLGSVFGDLGGTLVLMLIAQPLASFAIKIGPFEMTAILVFAIVVIGALTSESLVKAIIAFFVGMAFGCIGLDIETGGQRLTFDLPDLYDGIPVAVVGLGIFALAEMLLAYKQSEPASEIISASEAHDTASGNSITSQDLRLVLPTYLRSTVVGVVIGSLPGVGGTIASFMSYTLAQKLSRTPEKFGHGALEGVAASETADAAHVPAGLVPLFTIGIPGTPVAALLIGAFLIHGVQPGPLMFDQHPDVVAGIYASMMVASVLMLIMGWTLMRMFAALARLSTTVIVPPVLCLCILGAYLEGESMLAVYMMLGFGIVGYIMKMYGFPLICLITGFVLERGFERGLRQSIALADGDPLAVIHQPIALAFLIAAAVVILLSLRPTTWRKAATVPSVLD
jgi:putative tricarboxylic transport membrane protein